MAQKDEIIPDEIAMSDDVKLKDDFVCASYPVYPSTKSDEIADAVLSYLDYNFAGNNEFIGNTTSAFISMNTTVEIVKNVILDSLSHIGLNKKNFNNYISLFQYGNEVLITAFKY